MAAATALRYDSRTMSGEKRGGSFLALKTPQQATDALARFAALARVERLPVGAAVGRVPASPILAPCDEPRFRRSAMDGYALRAEDTFGAGEGAPAYLRLAGRVEMGRAPDRALSAGEAMEISTGARVPEGADAVVMVEHTERAGETVEIVRPVGVGQNVILPGDDVRAGTPVVAAFRRLRPADVAMIAALGITSVEVFARPRVAIVSTGDELVPFEETPGPAQVRDVNSLALSAQVERAGGIPSTLGIVRDDPSALRAAVSRALEGADVVLLSGGSSAGVRDHTAEVLDAFGPPGLLFHGIAVAPGKPTIAAARGNVPLFGMPGYPVSSLVIFELFVRPVLERLGGVADPPPPFGRSVRATLARQIASKPGREDWVRVGLSREADGGWSATPVRGSTGTLSSIASADGVIRVGLEEEGVPAGREVEVFRWE